jgi:hypothetical protein
MADQEASPSLTMTKQQRQLDDARDAWLVLQAVAEGYRQNARHIERMQGWLDFLGFLNAMGLIVVLWGIKELIPPGDYQSTVNTSVNVAGTFVAFALVSLMVMTWRNEWRGKTELHRELANQAERLATRFNELVLNEPLDENKLTKAKQDRLSFERDENKTLGGIPQWAKQRGFQHVGQRYPNQNIKCHECDRNWVELRPKLSSLWRFIWRRCNNCGVVR